jgi:prepilin-type N-terminal cleavage/methylation domain-containing protein
MRGLGMKGSSKGFTLIELMIVVAIIAFLSVIAVPNFFKFLAKAKRTEAYMNLHSIHTAQKVYWSEHGEYTTQLAGAAGAGWQPEGYNGGGASEKFYYTYGFGQGAEGTNFFTGKLQAPSSQMTMTRADKTGFVVAAVGDIDGDGQPDILTINEKGEISIVQDDLA